MPAGSVNAVADAIAALKVEAGRDRRPASISNLARDLLDAGDHLVDRLLDRDFLTDDPVHRLGPDVLVVQDGELEVLGEFKRHRAVLELVEHRAAMTILLPERTLLALSGDRKPATERAFDVGPQVFFLHQERQKVLGLLLVL